MSHFAPGWGGSSASICSSEADVAQLQGSMCRVGSYSSTSAGLGGDLIVKLHATRNLSIDWKIFCIGWRLLICAEARSMMRVLYCLQYFKFPSCQAAARQPAMQHFSGGGSQNVGMSQFLITDTHWHLLLWFLKDFKTQWILQCYSNGTKHGQPFLPRVQDTEIFVGSWHFYALILCVLTLF